MLACGFLHWSFKDEPDLHALSCQSNDIIGVLQLMEGSWMPIDYTSGTASFPAVYRQHVYFLSSADARNQFTLNPLAFLCQQSPKPVVPIRIAIVGPPKSGKSTRTFHCSSLNYVTLLRNADLDGFTLQFRLSFYIQQGPSIKYRLLLLELGNKMFSILSYMPICDLLVMICFS